MDLAALELQIFVSLAVVLGVAFVALVCDFLKGNNERLRERNIEYRVRESTRGPEVSPAELLQGIIAIGRNPELARTMLPGVAAPAPPPPPPPAAAPPAEQEPERATTWATKEELERLAERAARIRARHEKREETPQEAKKPETKTPEPVLVPSAAEPEPVQEAVVDMAAPEPEAIIAKVLPIDLNSAERYEPVSEASLQPAEMPAPQAAEPVAEIPPAAPVEEQAAGASSVPAGLHPVAALNSLIASEAPFSGVAVSIGINNFDALRDKFAEAGGSDSLAAVEEMIRSVMSRTAFGCRFQEDEYILLFPGEIESVAQRRLFQISEKLWDFQLRSLGHLSVMFSWGGLEVHGEPVKEAVAAARERMLQTKRGRKNTAEVKRKIVNG